jgi:hypothetical protein
MRSLLQGREQDTRREGFRTALDELVRSFRLTPANRDAELEDLMTLPAERATARLERLRASEPVLAEAARQVLTIRGNGGEENFSIPVGTDEDGLRRALEAQRSLSEADRSSYPAFVAAINRSMTN